MNSALILGLGDHSRSHTEKRSHSLAQDSVPRAGRNAVFLKVKSSVLQKKKELLLCEVEGKVGSPDLKEKKKCPHG